MRQSGVIKSAKKIRQTIMSNGWMLTEPQTTTPFVERDPWRNPRIDWLNVGLNLVTYFLLMTDVVRAGAATHLNIRKIAPGLYAWFGSFAYEVLTIHRDPIQLDNVTATLKNAPLDHARIWSYAYDTTSVGLRTITSMMNSTTHQLQCMNYELACDTAGAFTIPETFDMLDQVVDFVASVPDSALPAIYPKNPSHDYQFLRIAKVMKSRFVFIVYDRLIGWFYDPVRIHWMRTSHWPSINASLDICADPRDRPFLCDAGIISDFTYTADPSSAESSNVTFIWVSLNDRARKTYEQNQNYTVDISITETHVERVTYMGGWVSTVVDQFHVVVITRVRDCSARSDDNHSNLDSCRTIQLTDYRYQGGTVSTDLDEWIQLVLFLRVLAQVYYVIRLVSLLIGCYCAFPQALRSWQRTVFLFLSEVPSGVVVYGSIIPIAMYTIATLIDGPLISAMVHLGGPRLQGAFVTNPQQIYTLLCSLMRRQWLVAFLAMLWVRLQSLSGTFSRRDGIISVRGHIFGILASMSMIVGYYNPKLRDTRVLGFSEANTDYRVIHVRRESLDSVNRWFGGYYCDLFSIAASAVVYVFVVSVFRLFIRMRRRRFGNARSSVRASTENNKIGVLFTRTKVLPSTCCTLWAIDGLTCGWANDVLYSIVGRRYGFVVAEHTRRAMLMNIVQLTEPWNYLRLRLGLNVQKVCTYMSVETQEPFTVIQRRDHDLVVDMLGNTMQEDPVLAKEHKDYPVQVVGTRNANELSFQELVRIR